MAENVNLSRQMWAAAEENIIGLSIDQLKLMQPSIQGNAVLFQ